ncbi:MAG: hypothetical protein ACRDLD_02180 [Thermoleophilaceae bacterium]
MNLAEMRSEVQARGFDHKASGRIDLWLNRAYQRVTDRDPWPFLEATQVGPSPLSISDLRAVLTVVDTSAERQLFWQDRRTLAEADPLLTQTGDPWAWFMDAGALTAYPTSAHDLSVRYLKVAVELGADDVPLFDARYHYMLVDGAVALAYRDSDNFEAAEANELEFERRLREMADDLLVVHYDTPADTLITGSWDW